MRTIATPAGPLTLRPETPDDQGFLRSLFIHARPDLLLLPEPVRAGLVQMQFQIHEAAIRTRYPDARHEIVEQDGEHVGRLACDAAGPMPHLIDIALMPVMRNRGFGAAIIREVMRAASETGVSLNVADGNPAAHLYLRLGFAPVSHNGTDTRMVWRGRTRDA